MLDIAILRLCNLVLNLHMCNRLEEMIHLNKDVVVSDVK